MKTETFLFGMVAGVGALLVLKYGIVGLDCWNRVLHPGREDCPGMFSKPLLGALCGH